MYPMDFEEFLWANGIEAPVIQYLSECLKNETPVAEALHEKLRQLLLQYAVVGGMPAVVQTFSYGLWRFLLYLFQGQCH